MMCPGVLFRVGRRGDGVGVGRLCRRLRTLGARPRRVVALGIAAAAVEELAAAAAPAHELAFLALRTLHAGRLRFLLHVLARRVVRAADERTVTAALARERRAALGADLALDDLG